MTVKLVALWSTPTDLDGFEDHYRSTHLPLVPGLPGLRGAVASMALNGPYYRMAELVFESSSDLQSALGSPEGEQLLTDAGHLQETYGAALDVLTVEEQERL